MYGLNGKNTVSSNSDLILVGYGDCPEGEVNILKDYITASYFT